MNLNSIFEEHCSHLVFDKKLLKKVMGYEHDFVNKNSDHINFFGGVLMGVDAVLFTARDRSIWFDDLLGIDEYAIECDVKTLKDVVPDDGRTRHVSSDVMNLCCFYMAHKFLTSKHLSNSDRELGAKMCILVFLYKVITSTLYQWFKQYRADPIIAQATYSALSKKYGLKVAGSWGELLKNRAEITSSRGGLHYQRLMNFNDNLEIVYMINDTHGRVKSILKHIRDTFTAVSRNPDLLVKSVSATIELDGEIKIRDKTRLYSTYSRYILDNLIDERSFIINELVTVISNIVTTAPKSALEKSLVYMSANSSVKDDKTVQELCEVTLQHAFDYLTKNPTAMSSSTDIPGLLKKMRDLYQASRATDDYLIKMRELAEGIATRATGSKNKILISAIRNAILLYIILRTFTMNHYSPNKK